MIDNKLQKLRLQNKTPIYIIRGSSESKSLILNKKGVSGFEKTIFVIIIFLVFSMIYHNNKLYNAIKIIALMIR